MILSAPEVDSLDRYHGTLDALVALLEEIEQSKQLVQSLSMKISSAGVL